MTNGVSIEPYRVLFPIGAAYGAIGAALWAVHAVGGVAYPGVPHREWMMLGFEQAFVLGFLLTAMPAFTHGARCRPEELAIAVASLALLGVGILMGHEPTTAIASLAVVGVAVTALGRRVLRSGSRPPAEFLFVGLGLLAGVIGAALRLAVAMGARGVPPRFDDRLVSMGMVLPLVLGLGSLLVPTFAGFRDPLVIPGVAGPHDPRGRRALYGPVIVLLAVSFVADLVASPRLGHALRSVAAWTMILVVWRPWRPGRAGGVTAAALRVAGPLTALGVTLAAAMPAYDVAALHVTFIGGFALLTLAIGTRVIVSHGHRPLEFERATLDAWVLAGLGVTLAARIAAELLPAGRGAWLAISAIAWLAAWALWGVRAYPAVVGRTATRAAT